VTVTGAVALMPVIAMLAPAPTRAVTWFSVTPGAFFGCGVPVARVVLALLPMSPCAGCFVDIILSPVVQ
jgi:hypothetical protein